ncbi:uncharacterized protein K02A2.6-like [Lingula anatina]|uniref:Uncharacterized protein K02A2.6-like n=1 Tax=Lingula anatina TaxID=7574 RepID=A0A1S3HLN2_LINAN|nr:uncharacterized protein K02A2.6-like [Lingula anatina]|eukprot:XP_013385929.1 uncharacterized protein K02A2.6-like [Lingula anatina]
MNFARATFPAFSTTPTENAGIRWEKWIKRLDNFIVSENITIDAQKKALLLHLAGEEVFELSETIGVVDDDDFTDTKQKLTQHFLPRRNVEYEVYVFRQATQLPSETLDAFCARLKTLSKHCEFQNATREIKSQIIQKCSEPKVREKGIRDSELTLENLLQYGRTLEATRSQSKIMSGECQEHEQEINMLRKHPKQDPVKQTPSHQQQQTKISQHSSSCPGCGGPRHNNRSQQCPAWGKQCRHCNKDNHFSRVCRARLLTNNYVQSDCTPQAQANPQLETLPHQPQATPVPETPIYQFLYSTNNTKPSTPPYTCKFVIGDSPSELQIDTGASVTILSSSNAQTMTINGVPLLNKMQKDNATNLVTYSGGIIKPLGQVTVPVCYEGNTYSLPCYVVQGSGPNLLGRDWIQAIAPQWSPIFMVSTEDYTTKFPQLFNDGLGKLNNMDAKLHVDENAIPVYCRPRPVPLAMKGKVEAELERLVADGVLRPVQHSDWAAPIVPVLKPNGEIRICGDYKLTINTASRVERYPIPSIDDLYASLSGGQYYSKLDLSHAYQQICLHPDSQLLTTINTTKGLFAYTRLCYGIASAPGIFQRLMEQVVQNIPMVSVYLDDILVSGRSYEEAHTNLITVLQRLQEAGLRLRKEKCTFMQRSVVYLGHRLDSEGIHPTDDKLLAIQKAPTPTTVAELRSYLGLLNYYHRFLKNLSTVLAPLHELLHEKAKWHWKAEQERAFQESKKLLQSSQVLVYYNPELPLLLSCDASPYGVGAVLSHRMPDGSDKPIAFTSRTLTSAEKNYAHLEREGLAIIHGLTKFHKYLYGRDFCIQTDHKPLLGLLKEDKPISHMASARIQRWSLILGNYQYHLEYRSGSSNSNADALSRLPLISAQPTSTTPEENQQVFAFLDNETLVTSDMIRQWTSRDPILSQVCRYVQDGWPEKLDQHYDAYVRRRHELSVEQGILMWGLRVVVPPQGREFLLNELHESHPGIVRMKGLARSYVWWPNIDTEVERKVRDCDSCQVNSQLPPSAPLQPWEWPGRPWHRIHIDYMGPFEGRMILVIVDAHSKFVDAHVVHSATTSVTLTKLRQTFAMMGIPNTIVSDNGTCFTSEEFTQFCKCNGIQHITSSPYHPASNGLAERAVQTIKNGLKKADSVGNLEDRLYRLLLMYRVTPQTTTGQAPADLVMKHKPRTRLDLVKPDVNLHNKVVQKQDYDKVRHDMKAIHTTFYPGDTVWAVNFQGKPKWLPGVLQERLGPLTFTVRLQDGRLWRRHQDHLKARSPEEGHSNDRGKCELTVEMPPMTSPTNNSVPEIRVPETVVPEPTPVEEREPQEITVNSDTVVLRRSNRISKPPDRLNL